MHVSVLFRKLSELLGPQAQLLWNSSERHLSFLLLDVTRRINTRNDSDPDFVVLESFDQADVLVVSTTLFNTNPLQGSNVIILCLIVLVNRSHLLSGQQDELTEDKVQVGASLLDVRLFERFHEDVAFSWIWAGYRQDREGLSTASEIDWFVQKRHDSNLLKVFLDANLPQLGVSGAWQQTLGDDISFKAHCLVILSIQFFIFVLIHLFSLLVLVFNVSEVEWLIFALELTCIIVGAFSASNALVFGIFVFFGSIVDELECLGSVLLFVEAFVRWLCESFVFFAALLVFFWIFLVFICCDSKKGEF